MRLFITFPFFCLRRVARRDASNFFSGPAALSGSSQIPAPRFVFTLSSGPAHTHTHTWNTHGMRVESVGGKRDPQRDSLALLPLAREGSPG